MIVSGNVGIGTNSPTHTLDVTGDCISLNGTCINTTGPSNTVNYVASTLYFADSLTVINTASTHFLGAHGTASPTSDTTGILITRSGFLSHFYVKADANTWSGNSTFTIFKNAVTTGVSIVLSASGTSTSDTSSSISVNPGDRISVQVITSAGSGSLTRPMLSMDQTLTTNVFSSQWVTNGNGTDIGYNNGKVGIGTISPNYMLDVNGDLNITAGSALRFGGTSVCTSTGCTSSSDLKLKENIKTLPQSLEKVIQLRGIEYNYKDKVKFGEGRQIGVIAQEVEKVYPELVKTDSKTGFKAVAYDHLVAPLIEAVKFLNIKMIGIKNDQENLINQIALMRIT